MLQTELDFSDYIAKRTLDFTGREWVFAEIDRWLADPDAPCYFIITGEPGIGKTAIAARLTQIRELAAVHFCITRQADTIDPLNFARSLSHQLMRIDSFAQGIPEEQGVHVDVHINVRENYGQIIGVQIENLLVEAPSAAIAFNRVVLDPLRRLYAGEFDGQLLILVDALDEAAQQRGPEAIVDLLADARGLPSQVRFVLTLRPEGAVLRHFEQLSIPHLVLDAGREKNLQDVREYIGRRIDASEQLQARLAEQGMQRQVFIERATDASKGNFLYLVWLLRSIAEGTQRFDALEALPSGLDGIYREFLRTRTVGKDIDRWRDHYRPLLGVLAAAQEPLTAELLASFTGLDRQQVKDTLLDVEQFLDPLDADQDQYRLYHQSVPDFLGNEEQAQEFWIDIVSVHRQIADYYLQTYGDTWPVCGDVYCLQNLAAHLTGAGRSQDLCLLVQDSGWYSTRSRYDPSRRGYVSDLDLAFAVGVGCGSRGWPYLAANSLIRATLGGIARYLPVEAYEALVRVGRGQEALQRARMVSEAARKARALAGIEAAARELGENDLAEESRRESSGLPVQDGTPQTPGNNWLPDHITRFGARRALQTLLQQQITPDPDRSGAVERYLRVVKAASAVGQLEEARELLLECLDLIDGTWDHHRQDFLVRAARLSLDIGSTEDLTHIIELAREIELEHFRVYTLAEVALICSDAPDESLKKHSLEAAVEQVASVNRTSTLQFELSKIALAMSRLGDGRAGEFLERAIQLAGRPTQSAWRWEEKEAWVHVAEALTLVGLCDEALGLIKRIGSGEMSEGRIVVELALQDRWEDAWQLAQDAHPIVRERALLNTAHALAKKSEFGDKRYQAIVTCIEEDVKEQNANDRIAILGQLVDLALIVHDGFRGHQYLRQMMDALDEVEVSKTADLIVNIAHCAVKLSEIDEVYKLKSRAEALEEDTQYDSRSNAIGAIAIGLAKLEREEDAWSLAQSIAESGKRLEVYVGICESERRQGRPVDEHFRGALAFARSIDNAGWVPTFWGKLAVLARHLGYQAEEGECVRRAIEGTHTIELPYAIGFNIHNSANVAQALHELGLSVQAKDLLKFGLSNFRQGFLGIDSLRRLVQSVKSIGAKSLWADVIQVVQTIEKPPEKAEALLGIAHAVGRSGDISQATEILPSVLAAIEEADQGQRLALEFGAALSEFLEPEGEVLSDLTAEAFGYARSKDRPTALTWIAGLLPAFAKAGSALPMETWTQIEQCEKMLGQSTS